jgi:uncharacterized protein (TIGR00255 family)
MILSMTGFAAGRGQMKGYGWSWDLRAVNGRGLDLRLRVPDWIEGLEAVLRAELGRAVQRGNVSLSLRVTRAAEAAGENALRINPGALSGVLQALCQIEAQARDMGLALAPTSASEVLNQREVLASAPDDPETAGLRQAVLAELPALISAFNAARQAEGQALAAVIGGQLALIAALTADAVELAAQRRESGGDNLRAAVTRLLETSDAVDEPRLAQELALIAVRQDVTEELDRLAAHVQAAQSLLQAKGPVGRKFDFLVQEFMREANTLCSKSQDLALTRVGLELKAVIDQLREQIQNVE